VTRIVRRESVDLRRIGSRFVFLEGFATSSLSGDRPVITSFPLFAGVSCEAMKAEPNPAVTQLLVRWTEGDKQALEDLLPLVYDELRRLARRYLQQERPGHTLQSTALVHEAYIRL